MPTAVMASTFVAPPNHDSESSPSVAQKHRPSTTSLDSNNHLSPALSRVNSDSVSPSGNHYETPAASTSTLSHYQSSDISDLDEDLLFGVNFNDVVGQEPSFLSDWEQPPFTYGDNEPYTSLAANASSGHHGGDDGSTPLTPDHTASIYATSPRSEVRSANVPPASISPQELQKPFPTVRAVAASQLTPSQSSSGRSSEDGQPPAPPAAMHSPRVTISVWGRDGAEPVHTVERSFNESPSTMRGGYGSAGDLIYSQAPPTSAPRDSLDSWGYDQATDRDGLDPRQRPTDVVPSVKEMAAQREVDERNQDVGKWLTEKLDEASAPLDKTLQGTTDVDQTQPSDDYIHMGSTENKFIPGQTYYSGEGGPMTQTDFDIIASDDKWGDIPMVHSIRSPGNGARHQPQTSQAAIEKFEKMFRDTDSILSRAATWGTRRRSLPSISDFDIENVTSGNILKKLSISRNDGSNKSSSLLKDLRGLMVRRPSNSQKLKRSRSGSTSAPQVEDEVQQEKQESGANLPLPPRTSSWGRRPSLSISDAIMSIGGGAASIAATHHARSGSISGGTPIVSPRSPRASISSPRGSLSINLNSLRRPRSRSELPPSSLTDKDGPTLVDLLKASGGPPVPALNRTPAMEPADDDDDDDDDLQDDGDLKAGPNMIDDVTPSFAGFQQHILALNPDLSSTFLVDRIAHQQIVRYKHLLNLKVRHLGLGANCPCGSLCMAMGGTAKLDTRSDFRGIDPLSAQFEDEDGAGPLEGGVSQESFPQDIPAPPTEHLPAEFECQLCYTSKKFQKPSDWTKHVHEDVQPFTCTWDKCREPKMFKRKADWVRHENEGHRHLEWWTCDVEDCRHTCYRRDNFLQHLVREHKFLEPKVKTKAAVKRAGATDPTWQKVEQCHYETTTRAQEEPCRFCGKSFPTWKKLTVHLAKHMEQISLPVLRLVAAKARELAADTIISPVQDPPPRHLLPLVGEQTTPVMPFRPANLPQQPGAYSPTGAYMFIPSGQEQYPQQQQQQQPHTYFPSQYNMDQNLMGYQTARGMQTLPVTTAPYMAAMPDPNLEPFPSMQSMPQGNGGLVPGQQMHGGYEAMMVGPSSGNASPFSGQGSVSPFVRSPHQGHVGEGGWDERNVGGW